MAYCWNVTDITMFIQVFSREELSAASITYEYVNIDIVKDFKNNYLFCFWLQYKKWSRI